MTHKGMEDTEVHFPKPKYWDWKLKDVVGDDAARGWLFPWIRETFPTLAYLADELGSDLPVFLRAFSGVSRLHDSEISVEELYNRIEAWSPGNEKEGI